MRYIKTLELLENLLYQLSHSMHAAPLSTIEGCNNVIKESNKRLRKAINERNNESIKEELNVIDKFSKSMSIVIERSKRHANEEYKRIRKEIELIKK